MGVRLVLGKEHGELRSLRQADHYDVLLMATCFQPALLHKLTVQAGGEEADGGGGGEGGGGGMWGRLEAQFDTLSTAAIAVVAHFEASARTAEAAAWLEAAEPFDWSRQFFTQAALHEGKWRISNAELEADGILIQNMVCYPNRVTCKVDAHGKACKRRTCPTLDCAVGVPPTYYFVFTLDAKPEVLQRLLVDGALEQAPAEVRGLTRKLLRWAKETKNLDPKKVDELVRSAVRRFTAHYVVAGDKHAPAAPLSDSCELLRALPLAHGYDPIDARKTVDIFDFTGTSRMASDSAAAIVTKVDGVRRARGPLLFQPIGDALQEPFCISALARSNLGPDQPHGSSRPSLIFVRAALTVPLRSSAAVYGQGRRGSASTAASSTHRTRAGAPISGSRPTRPRGRICSASATCSLRTSPCRCLAWRVAGSRATARARTPSCTRPSPSTPRRATT